MILMRIGFGADHGGCALKDELIKHVQSKGVQVTDFGTNDPSVSVDYPRYAQLVGTAVANRDVDLGVLCCGTGIGMSIAANKIPGVRAALVHDVTTARLAKEHNNANILVMGGRLLAPALAFELLDVFLNSSFEARHQRRLDMVAELETSGRESPA